MGGELISLIVPTRARAQRMLRFLESVRETVSDPQSVEVIMVVDDDDLASQAIAFRGLDVQTVVVPAGQTMGALNMAGYRRSRGAYLMLMNDDVVVRTPHWDRRAREVFRSFDDGIVLVHVNDMIFREKLCTFPFLSRRFCEMAGGICQGEYLRYRIDDHIYNVFNLLALLGHRRIAYLPDVVFEHENTVAGKSGTDAYVPDPVIHERDTRIFDALLDARKELALRLVEWIDGRRRRDVGEVRRKLLAPVKDSVSLRRMEFVRPMAGGKAASSDSRVTVGVVSANLNNEHARKCIELLKAHTRNFDLIVLDNNRGPNFNHSREMNRILEVCRTDYLVLMDDDVWVGEGWLEGLIGCVDPDVGAVTPMHLDREGRLSYAGVVMSPEWSGHHSHSCDLLDRPVPIQTLCSAVMLIDMTKVGHLRLDESYSKYFLDIDYGLRVWEAGFKVVCADVTCTHLGGATLEQGSAPSMQLFEEQLQHWLREWVGTGRIAELRAGIWSRIEELRPALELPQALADLMARRPDEALEEFIERALPRLRVAEHVPVLRTYIRNRVEEVCLGRFFSVHDPNRGHLMVLYGMGGSPTLIDRAWFGHDIYLMGATFFAMLEPSPVPSRSALAQLRQDESRASPSLAALRSRLKDESASQPRKRERKEPLQAPRMRASDADLGCDGVQLVVHGFLFYNIVRTSRYYGILQGQGAFDVARVANDSYRYLVSGDTLGEVRRAIVRMWFHRLPPMAMHVGQKVAGRVLQRIRRLFSRGGRRATLNPVITSAEGSANAKPDRAHRNLVRAPEAQRQESEPAVVLVDPDRRGHAVFLFEEQYFCVPVERLKTINGSLTPGFCRVDKVEGMVVCHSLAEVDEVLARMQEPAGEAGVSLVMATLPAERTVNILNAAGRNLNDFEFLVASKSRINPGLRAHDCGAEGVLQWARNGSALPASLANRRISKVVIPWSFPESWTCNALEAAAARIAKCVEVVPANGVERTFWGENLHRLVYNKAYLSSMLQVMPDPRGRDLLEVGCSDGLVCDLLSACGARSVTGIDVMRTAGSRFPGKNISYYTMSAAKMDFADESFDLVYSIATLEHVQNPGQVLSEIKRVTKRGGYAYVQAGPLYHSPFGHHMFAYFQERPWIHLLLSTDEILELVGREGIDRRIKEDLALTAEEYVKGMFRFEHVNGLFLGEYGLDEFMAQPDLEVLKFNVSYEGKELLNQEILGALSPLSDEQLTEHGFELAFRRR